MNAKDLVKMSTEIVCRQSGYEKEEVLHSRKDVCVNVRCAWVRILRNWLTDDAIAQASGVPRPTVNRLYNQFDERYRQSWELRICYDESLREITRSMM